MGGGGGGTAGERRSSRKGGWWREGGQGRGKRIGRGVGGLQLLALHGHDIIWYPSFERSASGHVSKHGA